MKLRDLVGKRVELLQDECWAASRGYVTSGHRGTVELADLAAGRQPLVHIHFDKVRAREGGYFGIGFPEWEFSEARQQRLRIVEDA